MAQCQDLSFWYFALSSTHLDFTGTAPNLKVRRFTALEDFVSSPPRKRHACPSVYDLPGKNMMTLGSNWKWYLGGPTKGFGRGHEQGGCEAIAGRKTNNCRTVMTLTWQRQRCPWWHHKGRQFIVKNVGINHLFCSWWHKRWWKCQCGGR